LGDLNWDEIQIFENNKIKSYLLDILPKHKGIIIYKYLKSLSLGGNKKTKFDCLHYVKK
jgi:hypothetical protein